MIDSDGDAEWQTDDPKKLAYRIYEGLKYATANKIEPFCNLDVRISVQDDLVIVKNRHSVPDSVPVIARGIFPLVDGFQTLLEIVNKNPHINIFEFPDCEFDPLDNVLFMRWKEKAGFDGTLKELCRVQTLTSKTTLKNGSTINTSGQDSGSS